MNAHLCDFMGGCALWFVSSICMFTNASFGGIFGKLDPKTCNKTCSKYATYALKDAENIRLSRNHTISGHVQVTHLACHFTPL